MTASILADMTEITSGVMLCTAFLITTLVLFFFALIWWLVVMRQSYRTHFQEPPLEEQDRWHQR